ncbi:Chloride channel protein 1 (ClC-1) (Chloride channel protein [Durusdinium trenchii]|uniref:Skeletal muscle n=1 Tax=Durusdinium trenchii TaxID=1381693 RepID=A0ABP0K1B9_9DINO
MEAEGSGFPEMKAMLFGKVLFNYLTLRVLVSKAVALSLGVGAGLPLGKEGPNVHLAACIARVINPSFFEKRVQSSHGAHGAGGSGVGSAVSKLLLAACAVGVGASFSAPIGGVIFALELMLPQTYDAFAYWGCFTAGVVGAITYAVERTLTTGGESLLPLISSNVLPGEGSDTDYPILRLAIDIALGILCGLGGGIWVRCHAYTAGVLKRWRLRESQPTTAVGNQEPLLGESAPRRGCCACLKRCLVGMLGGRWRDLALVAAVTALNTVLASSLPLLGGKPQPLLISTIFDKTLLFSGHDTWVLPWAGVTGTICLCFLMKWTMTILALSSAIPAGVVAPTMIIGGLLGRVFGHVLLPDWLVEMLLTKEGQPPTGMQKGAFMARCAIVGASAFCAAVCRAFAMAITVFEVLALPNSVLPLCSSALAAIFVANKVSLPFFDANLATRNLGGIPAITFTDKAIEPVMKVMRVVDLSECLPQVVTLRHLLHVISTGDHDFFPIVRPLDWDTSNQGLLEGSMTRKQAESTVGSLRGLETSASHLRLLKTLDPHAATPDREIDLMNPEYQAPPDGGEPLVEGSPVRVSPDCTVKDVYLLMKVAESDGVVYVTDRGILQGTITLSTLMSREV